METLLLGPIHLFLVGLSFTVSSTNASLSRMKPKKKLIFFCFPCSYYVLSLQKSRLGVTSHLFVMSLSFTIYSRLHRGFTLASFHGMKLKKKLVFLTFMGLKFAQSEHFHIKVLSGYPSV